MNEFTRSNALAHGFNKHAFNLKYYRDHMKEKHDYNVWYYQNNKDKWKIKGGTNADGTGTNPRPTTTTGIDPDYNANHISGPKQRVKGKAEKVADALLRHIPGYGSFYKDAREFAQPLLKTIHAIAGWKTPGRKFIDLNMNVSVSDVKATLTEWEKRINKADKQIQDFKKNVRSAIDSILDANN